MATQSASSSSTIPPTPPPPPQPKESLGRRYKFIWPILLAVNFSIGAYLFTRTNKEEKTKTEEAVPEAAVTSTAISTASVSPPPAIPKQVKPIPMDEQLELFKWILEEKRKVKTKDPQEKKRIDEEKAMLKQFIRAKSIPTL